jgi:hypothetical protein
MVSRSALGSTGGTRVSASGTVSISRACIQMTTLRPCDAIAHPAMIDATMKAAEPAPRTQPYSKPRGVARRDETRARASARFVVGARAVACRRLTANSAQKEPAPR